MIFLCCRAVAAEHNIEKIWFEKSSLTEEKIFFKLGEYGPPHVFGLEGERKRLVCDFFNTKLAKDIPRTLPANGDLVLRVRIGVHTAPEQKTRVVLDLASIGRNYTILQHFYEDNLFVITVLLK